MMNILFFASGRNVPSTRFRVEPLVSEWRKTGHYCQILYSFPEKYDYFPYLGFRPSQWLKRANRASQSLLASSQRWDVVYLERELFDAPDFEWDCALSRLAKLFVVDIDDAVFLRYPTKFRQLARNVDLVIAGNTLIADYFEEIGTATTIVPTCLNLDEYIVRQPPRVDVKPTVGWIGVTGNLPYLEIAAKGLEQAAEEFPFKLRLITGTSPELPKFSSPKIEVEHVPWNPETDLQELRQCDIGIMPLSDDPWSRHKCGLKLLQYMAMGIPAIASPVGVNCQIIQHRHNGWLAETTRDWTESLLEGFTNRSLWEKISHAGRRTVEEGFDITTHAQRLANQLSEKIKLKQALKQ